MGKWGRHRDDVGAQEWLSLCAHREIGQGELRTFSSAPISVIRRDSPTRSKSYKHKGCEESIRESRDSIGEQEDAELQFFDFE